MEQNKTENNTKQNKRKTYPIRPIFHGFDTHSRYSRHSARLWKKNPFYVGFLDEPDTPLDIQVPPSRDF